MNIEDLKAKVDAFRNHPVTRKTLDIAKSAATMVVVGFAVKAVSFIAVEGTKALIREVNDNVNKSTN